MHLKNVVNWVESFFFESDNQCADCKATPIFHFHLCEDCSQRLDLVRSKQPLWKTDYAEFLDWKERLEELEQSHIENVGSEERKKSFDIKKDFCEELSHMDFIYTAAFYNNYLREIFSRYKFEKQSYLEPVFTEILIERIKQDHNLCEVRWITYVPMSPEKQIKRGYNPMEEVCRSIAKARGLRLVHLLEKTKKTKEQNKSRRMEREINLKDSFRIAERNGIVSVEQFDNVGKMDKSHSSSETHSIDGTKRCKWLKYSETTIDSLKESKGLVIDDFLTSGNTMLEVISTMNRVGIKADGLAIASAGYPKDFVE